MAKIAILGCGTVGAGVCRLLEKNKDVIASRLGEEICVKRILARTPQKARALGFDERQICSDINDILDDEEISVVVELMGGTDTAYDYDLAVLRRKKNLVTANKDLVELRWHELFGAARENGVELAFEASVGGGIPVITSMTQSLCANRFLGITGILNGTTNYILSKMTGEGLPYEQALTQAQALGYAEADPASDVGGLDAARKIAILASLAFNTHIELEDVYCEGITEIERGDVELASKLGYTIKLLAAARDMGNGVLAFVRPAFVPLTHPIASVGDVFNAVFITADAADDLMLYGRGAGAAPTASAVVGDIMDVCRNARFGSHGRFAGTSFCEREALSISELVSGFFVKMLVEDKPKVLAGVAGAFGEHGVSLASLVQKPAGDGLAQLVMITHPVKQLSLDSAVSSLLEMDYVKRVRTLMCLSEKTGEKNDD